MANIQLRLDDELKNKADELFKDLGLDTTTAIRMFLTQAVSNNGIPFEIKRKKDYEKFTEDEILTLLEKSRKSAERGEYKDAVEVVSEIKEKYGI